MSDDRRCAVCGADLAAAHKLAQVCSKVCDKERQRLRNRAAYLRRKAGYVPTTKRGDCEECGERIPLSRQSTAKTCSATCSDRRNRRLLDEARKAPRDPAACSECGEMHRRRSPTCSHACTARRWRRLNPERYQEIYERSLAKKNANHVPKSYDLVCEWCSVEFTAPRRRLCCSRECDSRRGRIMNPSQHGEGIKRYWVTCRRCGERVKHRSRDGKYCSACRGRAVGAALSDAHRQKRLPVLHPNPDPLTWLPKKHPAIVGPINHPAKCGWSFLVGGSCAWCGETFLAKATAGNSPRYCSQRCSRASGRSRQGRRFKVPPQVRQAIYERDEWICQLCGDPVDPDLGPSDVWAATLDHIECQSWATVPDHSPENLRLAHRWCNSVRADESYYDEDILKASQR